jgi:hypothetical protein
MVNEEPVTAAVEARHRRWPFFLIGVFLFVLGPAIYAGQFYSNHLQMPWYVPILASVGVLFLIASLRQKTTLLRGAGLVALGIVCALQWYIALVATKTPAYTGPARVGAKVPAFAAALPGGQAFTNHDLENGIPTVLVFFRGRW